MYVYNNIEEGNVVKMAIIIDGKMIAKKTRENLKKEVEELKKEGITPKLAVIMVGDNPASKVYVKNKSKACDEVGVEYEEYILEAGIKQKELLELIQKLNNNKVFYYKVHYLQI